MPKKMLIDATHAEETRVVVVDGNRVEEFDFESLNKRQLAGNIYLAKITRVEPSLQAAFVDYGGNRHGFLAFSEIHPDYYQIPVADREALLAEEAAYAKAIADEEAKEKPKPRRRRRTRKSEAASEGAANAEDAVVTQEVSPEAATDAPAEATRKPDTKTADQDETPDQPTEETAAESAVTEPAEAEAEAEVETEAPDAQSTQQAPQEAADAAAEDGSDADSQDDNEPETLPKDAAARDSDIESVADDDVQEEVRPRKPRPRRYKIQEVVKVRQIMLIQVVKEERGNKGAALTTYLSLAGRYCVLMPNTARGGGISRKITNAADRKKLKDIANSIEVPEGAGLIVRTAGAKRTKTEIKRDYEYLLRQWEQIRDLTLKSIAPAPIYEEGSLIKRSIRDLYNREIDEVFVEGEAGYRIAKDYMKMLMPSHAKNVKLYTDPLPLFARYQVESYLAGMFNPTVQLKSGGYIVIGVTEALVAIDVNSGRATKEGSIEETATKTNLEAAEEVARQLRLRDLAGLIVIDFIDMEERRNNAAVEKRIKEKLKTDRARIQVGRISGFGLMEMSRQRLRPGMIEATTAPCPHCHGTGLTRSSDSLALSILRELEEEGVRHRSREILVTVPMEIANYMLNQKREHIIMIETRYGLSVRVEADAHLISPEFKIERFKTATRIIPQAAAETAITIDSLPVETRDSQPETVATPEAEEEAQPKKRRRRRRRRGGNRDRAENTAEASAEETTETQAPSQPQNSEGPGPASESEETGAAKTEPVSPFDQVIETDDSASQEVDVPETSIPEKPKRKRAPRKKKPVAKADATPDATPAAEDATAEGAEEPAQKAVSKKADKAEEPAEKPKRKRAPRKKKPEKEAEPVAEVAEPVAEVAPPEVEVAEPVAEVAEPEVEVAEPVAEVAVSEAAVSEPAQPVVEPAEPVAAEPEKPAAPKRRGWWSRSKE